MNLPEWAKWVARDANGNLHAYEDKPYKEAWHGEWLKEDGEHIKILTDSFDHIKWSDAEPTELTPAEDNVIKPNHYLNENGQDLFEEWYQRLPFEVFQDVMRCVAERYIRRYPAKNGLIDLKKGIEVLNRLEKYEIRHLEEAT